MADPRGCLKNSLIGCGALIGLVVLFVVVMAGLAFFSRDEGGQVERDAVAAAAAAAAGTTITVDDPVVLTRTHPGRVILDLAQGEFILEPAAPGEGLSARASFDSEVHSLTQSFEIQPDSSWTSRITFRRTMPALQALFRQLMGGDTNASITIGLPADVPVELVVRLEQGGGEAEIGGLWLTTADFDFRQGGFELSVDAPLREPLERLRLHGRMGGVSVSRLGNASPRVLDVDCGMGGADIGLKGQWRNDCDARFRVRMGGMAIGLPADLEVEAVGDLPDDLTLPVLRRSDGEVPLPVLRVRIDQKMGEIEFRR
ncbi:MAG: hypothetical protein IH621_00305 [Krumholzibacteria bacterium]|nr:hypothetical protein [Candidatus Krumholzibacteria bacterium]